jgi:hypothetical protein
MQPAVNSELPSVKPQAIYWFNSECIVQYQTSGNSLVVPNLSNTTYSYFLSLELLSIMFDICSFLSLIVTCEPNH